MKKYISIAILVFITLIFVGCSDSSNPAESRDEHNVVHELLEHANVHMVDDSSHIAADGEAFVSKHLRYDYVVPADKETVTLSFTADEDGEFLLILNKVKSVTVMDAEGEPVSAIDEHADDIKSGVEEASHIAQATLYHFHKEKYSFKIAAISGDTVGVLIAHLEEEHDHAEDQ